MAEPPALRAGDEDRERALTRLRDAAVEGRLTLEELAERVELAHGAVTRDELAALTADLAIAPAAPTPPASERMRAVASRVARSGRWRVPARSSILSLCGTVDLDLRGALLPGPRVEIDLNSWFGTTTILVPEGVSVELDAAGLSATSELDLHGEAPSSAAPVLVVRSRGGFGTLRIQSRPRPPGALRAVAQALAEGLRQRGEVEPGEPPPG